jgi:hypothetical protein
MVFKVCISDVKEAGTHLRSFWEDSSELFDGLSETNAEFVSASGGDYVTASGETFIQLKDAADSFLVNVDDLRKTLDDAYDDLKDKVEKKREKVMESGKAVAGYSKNELSYQDASVVSDCTDADGKFQTLSNLISQAHDTAGLLDNSNGEVTRIKQNLSQLNKAVNEQRSRNNQIASDWISYQSAVTDFEGKYSSKFKGQVDDMSGLLDLSSRIFNSSGDMVTALSDPDKILDIISKVKGQGRKEFFKMLVKNGGKEVKDAFAEFVGSDFWIRSENKSNTHRARYRHRGARYTEFGNDLDSVVGLARGKGRHGDMTSLAKAKGVTGGFHAVGKAVGWLSAVADVGDVANDTIQAYKHTPGSERARREAAGVALAKGTASTALNVAASAGGQYLGEVIGASLAFTPFAPIAPVASVALGFAGGYLAGKGADLLSQKFGWKN